MCRLITSTVIKAIFNFFVCGRRNWQRTKSRVFVLDALFFAIISVSKDWNFKNRLDNGTSNVHPYMSLNFEAYWVSYLGSSGRVSPATVLSPSSPAVAVDKVCPGTPNISEF